MQSSAKHAGPGVASPSRLRDQPGKPQASGPCLRVPHAAQRHDDRRAQDWPGESGLVWWLVA